jgi:hypothetical protein
MQEEAKLYLIDVYIGINDQCYANVNDEGPRY